MIPESMGCMRHFCLQYARHYSGKGSGGDGKEYSKYIMSSDGAHSGCGKAERKAALSRKIGHVEYPERYVYSYGQNSVQQAKLQRTKKQCHNKPP